MKVGILGSGQLAQLLAHCAYSLGLETLCFSEEEEVPAARTSPLFLGSLNNKNALTEFSLQCDVITIENENIDIEIVKKGQSKKTPIYPPLNAIEKAQDRLLEKQLFQSLDIPTPEFTPINTLSDLEIKLDQIGCPAVLKTRRSGYDGKGQSIIYNKKESKLAWHNLGMQSLILEEFISFKEEVSLIAARSIQGDVVFYPLNKNIHEQGILRLTQNPYICTDLQKKAENYATRILQHLNYVGVLVIEFFVLNNELIANEIAPRVHNSGHGTIEGYQVSQFEMHLRAICNLPLLTPELQKPTWMYNIISSLPFLNRQEYKNAHFYLYGKEARTGRKLGHITSCEWNSDLFEYLLQKT